MTIKDGSRTGAPGATPPPPVEKKRLVFVNFHCIYANTLISQHALFTICKLFTTLLAKTWGMCEGASKKTRSKNSTAPGPRTSPVLKFLDWPLHDVDLDVLKSDFKVIR